MLTMTDCSDPDNRVQARYELDRAENAGTFEMIPALANWAEKWARPLLDYADAAPTEGDIKDMRAGISEQISAIRDALDELENI
jgi:hypothetical protein